MQTLRRNPLRKGLLICPSANSARACDSDRTMQLAAPFPCQMLLKRQNMLCLSVNVSQPLTTPLPYNKKRKEKRHADRSLMCYRKLRESERQKRERDRRDERESKIREREREREERERERARKTEGAYTHSWTTRTDVLALVL